MKKFLFLAVMAIASIMASAEPGDISVGLQFNYGTKNTLMGLGAGMVFEPVNRFRVAPEFDYYFKNNHWQGYNVNLNLHYLVSVHSGGSFYPIAGFSYANYKWEELDGQDHFGANVGVGYEYIINKNFRFFVEQKYQILSKDWNQAVSTLGMRYTF